jgi:hypothetical protein
MVSSQASSLFTAMWKKICCSHFRKGVQEVFQVESQIEEEINDSSHVIKPFTYQVTSFIAGCASMQVMW